MRTLVVFCNTDAFSLDKAPDLDNTEVGKYAKRAANARVQKDRLATFLITRAALNNLGLELTDIIHGEHGEPHLVIEDADKELFFSASHSEGVTVIAICEHPVGIDVEGEISSAREQALEERFLTGRKIESIAREVPDAELVIARLDTRGELRIMGNVRLNEKYGKNAIYVNNNLQICDIDPCSAVTAKWCTLEALIKSTGGGFADFLNTGAIATASSAMAYRITRGDDRLYMAIAQTRKSGEN